MKAWWTAKELAEQALPALGASERHVRRVAEEHGWANRRDRGGEALSRPRQGRGGGLEFHFTLLPPLAAAALAAKGYLGTTAPANRPVSEAWAAFEAMPEAKQAIARFRLAVLDEVEGLKRAGFTATGAVSQVVTSHRAKAQAGHGDLHDFGSATVFNWQKAVRGLRRDERLPALAPRTVGRTTSLDLDPDAWAFLRSDYLRSSRPTFESCHERLKAAAAEQGWTLPSAKTLQRRLDRDIPAPVKVLARDGAEALERMFPPMIRDRGDFHALQAVNADGHRWDVFVQFPGKPKPIRPMMVAIQDLYSNKILGYRIGESEGADLVQLAFGDVFRTWGVPDLCWLDNGRAFASKWITGGTPNRYRFKVKEADPVGVLTALGVEVRWTQPYSGRSKPIERAFRDLCDHGARHPEFQGAYTGNKPDAKPEDYASRAVPLHVFEAVIADLIRRHNAREGRRTLACRSVLSFDQAFEASYAQSLPRKAAPEQLRMCLLSGERLTCDRLTGAVTLFGNRYWSDFLAGQRGEQVVVRFDPNRLHSEPAHVYALSGAYLGAAELQEAAGFADAAAAREHSRARGKWLKAQREMLALERRLEAADVAALLPDLDDEPEAPRPTVVRLITGASAAVAPASSEPSFDDRYAAALQRQREERLRAVE